MNKPAATRLLSWILSVAVLCGCAGSNGATDTSVADARVSTDLPSTDNVTDWSNEGGHDLAPDVQLPELPLEPSQSYLSRKAEYLQFCFDSNGPAKGGIHGQVCRVALGGEVNTEAIEASCAKVALREDTSDFHVASMLRMLYLDEKTSSLEAGTRTLIEETILNFKYWIDQPGQDKMCYWTENHQVLFHSAELLAGQLYPDTVFANSGWTGTQHAEHARPLLLRWLELRGRFGFSEWHSNVYFNEDIPALVNLADFAEDPEISNRAVLVLDILAFDMLNNYFKGAFATCHGRTYPSKLLDGLKDSTSEAAWIMVGLGEYYSGGNFGGSFLATSDGYFTPELLELAAEEIREAHEHRQRDSIDVANGPYWGLSYEGLDDVVVWAGLAALVAPQIINGTTQVLDEYELWDGFLFGEIPEDLKGMLTQMSGTPALEQLATELELVSRGIALESMNTYTFRTAHYQLSGAQDYNPGMWATQTHAWQATLDKEAYVFTTYPSDMDGSEFGAEFAGQWIGSWLPRVTLIRNVGVIQYRREAVPMFDQYLSADYSHAFFPKDRFDEVVEDNGWVIGWKGQGLVALYSQHPTTWADDNDYELIADSPANVWIVEMGSLDEWGSFEEFVDAVSGAEIHIDDTVFYDSPTRGELAVGWEGPFTVGGQDVNLGPYARWDNALASQEFGSSQTAIAFGGEKLILDFENGVRTLHPAR